MQLLAGNWLSFGAVLALSILNKACGCDQR